LKRKLVSLQRRSAASNRVFEIAIISLVSYINEDRTLDPLDEGDHQPAYDVKRPVPHNGPWFLILDLYRCQTSRDVEVNLYKI